MINLSSYDQVIHRWKHIPLDYPESALQTNLATFMFEYGLGLSFEQIKQGQSIGNGLIPDLLIYGDIDTSKPPVLVVENKKRDSSLGRISEQKLMEFCQKPTSLYREAVGYTETNTNGIRQFLNREKVSPEFLASYGLVFNGDFFQLWRRKDGLVLPLTPIQKVSENNLPQLMGQLEYCLQNPQRALVTAVWNQKGGVAKTTNTINLGAVLAAEGKKVLLIDLDPQNDLTTALGLDPKNYSNYLGTCIQQIELNQLDDVSEILHKKIKTIHFKTTEKLTYSLSVLGVERKDLGDFQNNVFITQVPLFKKLLSILQSEYDYILLDTSPTWDTLTQCVLYAADVVLIPVDYGKKALRHAVNIYQVAIPQTRAERVKENPLHYAPWNLGIVFSNCPPTSVSKNSSETLPNTQLEFCIQQELQERKFTGKQCATRLRIYAQAKLAEFKEVPVYNWPRSPLSQLYKELANELFLHHNFVDS